MGIPAGIPYFIFGDGSIMVDPNFQALKIFRDQGHLKGEIAAMHRLARVDQATCLKGSDMSSKETNKCRLAAFTSPFSGLELLLFLYDSSSANPLKWGYPKVIRDRVC